MTVLGIAGCTALLVTGFGIKDSIQMIVSGQYGEILKYDMQVSLTNKLTDKEIENIDKELDKTQNIKSYEFFVYENGEVRTKKGNEEVNIVIPDNLDKLPSRFAAPCGICIKSAALIRQQSSMSTPALISAIEIASNPACRYIKQKTRRLCLQSPSFFSSAARMGTGTIRAQRMPGDTVRAGAAIFTRSGCGPVRISFWQRYSCAGYP